MTISHSNSGSNRLKLLGITPCYDSNETVSSVAHNGVALSLVGTDQRCVQGNVDFWRSVALEVVPCYEVIAFDSRLSRDANALAKSVAGVHRGAPVGAVALVRSPKCLAIGDRPKLMLESDL